MKNLGLSRLLLFGGCAGFAAVSFLVWYKSPFQAENAWAGELSLAAGLAMIAAAIVGFAGLKKDSPKIRLAEIGASVACLVCTLIYISDNSGSFEVNGRVIDSGMTSMPYIAAAAGLAMTAGSLMGFKR